MLAISGAYLQDLVVCQTRTNSLTAMAFLGREAK